MDNSLPIFLWTEINDNEGETWHMGIIPSTQKASAQFLSLKDKLEKLNKKFNNDTFVLSLFKNKVSDLDALINYGGGDYMPEWSKLETGFTFKFELLDFIASELLNSEDKLNLAEFEDSISNFPADYESDTKIKKSLISKINFYFKRKKYTKELGSLYDILILNLAYKMQIFD